MKKIIMLLSFLLILASCSSANYTEEESPVGTGTSEVGTSILPGNINPMGSSMSNE